MNNVSRNDPCPCGSGKKYKKCCLGKEPSGANASRQNISQTIQTALHYHQAGQLAEAESIYRQVLQEEPNQVDALHLLGMICYQTGNAAAAIELIGRALHIKPKDRIINNNLGGIYLDLGRAEEAAACFQKAIAGAPDYAEAQYNLGNAYKRMGRLEDAVLRYQKAISLHPGYIEALNNMGNACKDLGKYDKALVCYRKALALRPDLAEISNNMGVVYEKQGRQDEAVACYQQAISLKPDYAEAYNNLGSICTGLGRLEETINCCQKALAFKPDYAEAHNNVGNAYSGLGRWSEAVPYLQNAIALRPDMAEAHMNLGNAYKGLGRLDEAIACYRQAIAIRPDYADVYSNLGNVYNELGSFDAAAACYRKALEIQPDFVDAHTNLLFTMQYSPDVSNEMLFAESLRFAQKIEHPLMLSWPVLGNQRDPAKRLKVGYVSGDFCRHSVAYFIESILANHDKSQVESYCYYNNILHDEVTDRLIALADHWIACKALDDDKLCERIQADGIDILLDLSGHTAFNRLLVFAHKPAPVQATWIGCAGTTGLIAMDYRLTDANLDPPGLTDAFHTEKLVRLPASFVFKPDESSPPVSQLPALDGSPFTFACLNSLIKVTPADVALWARILDAVPNSRIMLGNALGNSGGERLLNLFVQCGLAAERVLLLPRLSMTDYLALHQQIDLALDPFPYNGGTTTCHSLWMGVPVVTRTGDRTVSRSGASILMQAGLPEFIAGSEDEYAEQAIRMAQDLPRLEEIRQGLRHRFGGSLALSPAAYTRELENAYRAMWQSWCGAGVELPA